MAKSRRNREAQLTPQQEAFAQSVAKGTSLADAYRAHYRVSRGAKAETVHECASRLARDRKVTARISELRAQARLVAERDFEVDIARWLKQLSRIAFSDIRSYYQADGRLKQLHELDDAAAAPVIGVVRDDAGLAVDYKLERKTATLEVIGRHLGAFDSSNRQTGDSAMKELMAFIATRGKLQPVQEVEIKERPILNIDRRAPPGALVPVEEP